MAVETAIDTVQGLIAGGPWFHLDTDRDVLYLRHPEYRSVSTFGEETPEGFTRLETEDGRFAGITVVDYWREYGVGPLDTASIRSIRESIADWALKHFPSN